MSQNYYPTPQPQPQHTIVYLPPVGNTKMNRSVSVIAIILIMALLFVGMGLFSEQGFYKEQKNIVWNRGYIDKETGLGVKDAGIVGNWNFRSSYGMYTKDAIAIKHGIKIELAYDSTLTYEIYVFGQHDNFIGILGTPQVSGIILDESDFTSIFAEAKFIRLYAYPRNIEVGEDGIPIEKALGMWDWFTCRDDITISVNHSNIKDDLEDVVG